MRNYYSGVVIALAVVIFGQVLYHVVAKSVSLDRQPWEIISAAYFTGFLLVTSVGVLLGNISISGWFSLKNLGPAVLVGMSVACIELGYLYAYRNYLPVSIGALSVLALTTVALVPIAVIIFEEPLRFGRVVGIVLTVAGVWLMQSNIKL